MKRRLAPLVIYLVHLGLVIYACPYQVFFGGEPLMGLDYQTHFEQTRTVNEALREFGRTWAYDPFLLAGQPAGLMFDVDNQTHALFTYLLTSLGLRQVIAFNLFAILAHLLAPLAIWLAARLFRTGARAERISFALGVLLWHFDSGSRWCWWDGMISFAIVSYSCPMVVALFYRFLEDKKPRFYLPLLVLLPLVLMIHVWAFATLVIPMAWLYARSLRTWSALTHAQVWGLVVVAIVGNSFWIWPVLHHLNLIAGSAQVGQANPLYFIADYLDIFLNPLHTGSVATRTLFRFAALIGAALSLWQWRKDRDDRFRLAMIILSWLLGLSYFGSLIPIIKETEPFRFILPSFFFAAVFCGPFWDRVLDRGWIRALSTHARVVLVVLLTFLVPRVVHQITYFIPELLPDQGGPNIIKPNIAGPKAVLPTPEFFSFRYDGIPEDYRQIAALLRDEFKEEGRVLVEWWVLGEYLRWSSGKPIIGGFPDRRMIQESSNLFRYRDDPRYRGKALADYLVRYNIRYLVISNPYLEIEKRNDLMELKRWVGFHRIYRIRHLADYFAGGSGVVEAHLNRLFVKKAKPEPGTQELVLRFHYLDTLRCSPGCSILKEPLPDNLTGFIRVRGAPRLPETFTVENIY